MLAFATKQSKSFIFQNMHSYTMLKPRENPFDRHKKPRNQALIGSMAGAERKPLTSEEYKKWLESRLPAKLQAVKPLTLPEKANELSLLAIRKGKAIGRGPSSFVNFIQYRRTLKKNLEFHHPDPAERRKGFISAVGGEYEIKAACNDINQWTEEVGRPDLKLTFDEMIDLILK